MRNSRLVLISCTLGVAAISHADGFASAISGPFTYGYLAAGLALPFLRDGRTSGWRTADSLGVTLLLTEGLKMSVRERRPDGSDHGSFPSAHTSLAFSVATAEARLHPREAVYWYLGAALIGESRVELRKHYVHDVLAGAALGYGTTMLELSLPRGLVLQPLIGPRKSFGFVLGGRF